MTRPVRGETAAAGTAAGDRASLRDQPPAMLVRVGGRWLCRHELAELSTDDDTPPDVQLRP